MRGLYWVLALVLVGFGALAILSIGAPFVAVGLTLVALAPFREHRAVFWPVLSAVIAFFVGYVLVAPVSCTALGVVEEAAGATESDSVGLTTCTNLLGIDYSGTGLYNPPLWPAVVAGVILAAAVALILRRLLHEQGSRGVVTHR